MKQALLVSLEGETLLRGGLVVFFPADITNYYTFGGRNNICLFSRSRGQKSKVSITELKSRCQQGPRSLQRIWSWPPAASGGHWHSLAYGHVPPVPTFVVVLPSLLCSHISLNLSSTKFHLGPGNLPTSSPPSAKSL